MKTDESQRIGIVDAARGAAVLGMVVDHAAWDLHFYGVMETDPSVAGSWRLFAHAVAASFLFVSGFSLVLAQENRPGPDHAIGRLSKLALAALAVTGATWLFTPAEAVRFGILQCVLVANIVALPMLQAPLAVPIVVAGIAILTPIIAAGRVSSAAWWLGLSEQVPATLDYQPVFPWIGVVLIGVVLGRLVGAALSREQPFSSLPLEWLGRRSLFIYLIHQPLLFAPLAALASLGLLPSGQHPRLDHSGPGFTESCDTSCIGNGTNGAACAALCKCAATQAVVNPGASARDLFQACRP